MTYDGARGMNQAEHFQEVPGLLRIDDPYRHLIQIPFLVYCRPHHLRGEDRGLQRVNFRIVL